MTDLRSTIQQKPDCLTDRDQLTGVLMDCGLEKRTVQVMLNLYDCGIVKKIQQGRGMLSQTEAYNLTVEQESIYGTSRQYIEEGIRQWAETMGALVEEPVQSKPIPEPEPKVYDAPGPIPVLDPQSDPKPEPPKTSPSKKRSPLLGSLLTILFCFIVIIFVNIVLSDAPTNSPSVSSTRGTVGENIQWKLKDGTLTISGQGAMDDFGALTNPAPWEDEKDTIETVVVEDGVTYIGANAFSWCDNLSKVVLSNSVKEIGSLSFVSCFRLREIEIPGSVKYIDRWAFKDTHLKSVRLSDDCLFSFDAFPLDTDILNYRPTAGSCGENAQWVLDDSGLLTISGSGEILPHSWPYMENDFFVAAPWYPRRSEIKSVIIENGITSIGEGVFYGCNTLTDVTIADSVNYIEGFAFSDCEILSEITLPDSITNMGAYVFSNCGGLENINLSSGITRIPPNTFEDCISLKEIQLPVHLTAIETKAFHGCESLERISVPESVTDIGYGAFLFCESLQSITLPKACIVDEGAIQDGVEIIYQN